MPERDVVMEFAEHHSIIFDHYLTQAVFDAIISGNLDPKVVEEVINDTDLNAFDKIINSISPFFEVYIESICEQQYYDPAEVSANREKVTDTLKKYGKKFFNKTKDALARALVKAYRFSGKYIEKLDKNKNVKALVPRVAAKSKMIEKST